MAWLTKSELKQLRDEIVLGSLYLNDYENSLGIDPDAVYMFFESFLDYCWEEAEETGIAANDIQDIYDEYDNIEDIYTYYAYMYDEDPLPRTLEPYDEGCSPRKKKSSEKKILNQGCGSKKKRSERLLARTSDGKTFDDPDKAVNHAKVRNLRVDYSIDDGKTWDAEYGDAAGKGGWHKRESYVKGSRRKSVKESSGYRSYTQRQIKDYVKDGFAIDVTNYGFDQMKDLLHSIDKEIVGISRGTYGVNGVLFKDAATGQFYAVCARNTASQMVI